MRNASKQVIGLCAISLVGLSLVGCKTAPRWDWWRVGQRGPADSSAVARSADVELPSVVASREEGTASGTSLAEAGANGGGVAPPFVPPTQTPSVGNLVAAGSPYPSTGVSTPVLPAGTQPLVTPPVAEVVPPPTGIASQQGPYDPNGYAAAHVAQAPPTVYPPALPASPLPLGPATDLAHGPPPGVSAPPSPVHLSPANPVPSYGVTSVPPPAGSSAFNTQDNALRNLAPPAPAPVTPPAVAPIATNVPPVVAPPIAVTTPPMPYRPGGTSDYPGAQASFSVAERTQPVVNNPVPAPTVPLPVVAPPSP